MDDNNYFYVGMGIIFVFLVIGVVGLTYEPNISSNQDAKITFEFSDSDEVREFTYFTSQEKLFSQNSETIKFSPVQKGVQFSSDSFNCEISCKKE